jgi:hypothetical protein
MAPSKHH